MAAVLRPAAPGVLPPSASTPSSLILAHRPQGRLVVILGSGKLAASRARASLEAGAIPLIVLDTSRQSAVDPAATTSQHSPREHEALASACPEIRTAIQGGALQWRGAPEDNVTSADDAGDLSEKRWESFLDDLDAGLERRVFALCVTDTLHSGGQTNSQDSDLPPHTRQQDSESSSLDRATLLAQICRKKRIPINVADRPELCDFSFPATHRFSASPSPLSASASTSTSSTATTSSSLGTSQPHASSLQIAVTTNGRGCRLAGRIRRDIVSALPKNVGDAVERVGELRDLAKRGDRQRQPELPGKADAADVEGGAGDYFEQQQQQGSSSSRATEPAKARRRRHLTRGSADAEEDDLSYDTTPLNSPVPQLVSPGRVLSSASSTSSLKGASHQHQQQLIRLAHAKVQEEAAERTKRRMRWVAQISEYWPIDYLGGMDATQMTDVLRSFGEDDEKKGGENGAGAAASSANGAPGTAEGSASAPSQQAVSAQPTTASALDEAERGRAQSPGSEDGPPRPRATSQHALSIVRPPPPRPATKGHIYLLGSGPGHPGLLTLLAHRLLTSPDTHLVLSDKLVPAPILRLIPSTTPLVIAKKFPGNAEGAQSELISLALQGALAEGKNVVRLKQGDPFVYGRGGEEVLAFRRAGVECTVVPGISSAIAAPLMLGVPVTQRGAADSLVLCTGVGRGGKQVKLPGYERARSLIVLMGVARLRAVVDILTRGWRTALPGEGRSQDEGEGAGEGSQQEQPSPPQGTQDQDRTGAPFPPYTPIAIIERASSSDQRLIASTLSGICDALEQCGEQRPPGMIMIGWSVLALEGEGDVGVLDDERECLQEETPAGGSGGVAELERRDLARVRKWLGGGVGGGQPASSGAGAGAGAAYIVREGLDGVYSKALASLDPQQQQVHEGIAAESGRAPPESEPAPPEAPEQQPRADTSTSTAAAGPGPGPDFSLSSRTGTGWAPPRYAS